MENSSVRTYQRWARTGQFIRTCISATIGMVCLAGAGAADVYDAVEPPVSRNAVMDQLPFLGAALFDLAHVAREPERAVVGGAALLDAVDAQAFERAGGNPHHLVDGLDGPGYPHRGGGAGHVRGGLGPRGVQH